MSTLRFPPSATSLVPKEKAMRQIGDKAALSREKKKNGYIGKKDGWSYDTRTLPQSSPYTQIHWNLRLWYLQWHPLP